MEKREVWENKQRMVIIIALLFTIILLLSIIISKKTTLLDLFIPKGAFPTLFPTEKWTKDYVRFRQPSLEQLKNCQKYSEAPTSDQDNWGEITAVDAKKNTIKIKNKEFNLSSFEGTQVMFVESNKKPALNEEPKGMLLALGFSTSQVLQNLKVGTTAKITQGAFGNILRLYCR